MKKQQRQPNRFTIVGGKVFGNFDPEVRAYYERQAGAAGLTFDQFMTRDLQHSLQQAMAWIS
jgi:hypothetical protein